MIRRWLALTYYLYALRLAALSHFYFNRLYFEPCSHSKPIGDSVRASARKQTEQHEFLLRCGIWQQKSSLHVWETECAGCFLRYPYRFCFISRHAATTNAGNAKIMKIAV